MSIAFPINLKKKKKRKKKGGRGEGPSNGFLASPRDPSTFASVEDYMEYVQQERESTPDVSTAPISALPTPPATSQAPIVPNWCENFFPRPTSLSPLPPTFIDNAINNFKQLQAYVVSIPITKNNPPAYPSEMTTAKLPPMKDFLAWNVRLFHGGAMDFETELAQALYVVPCTRAEYDNQTLALESGVLEGNIELYKRMDLAMLIAVLDHVSRPFVSSVDASPIPSVLSAYLSSADCSHRAMCASG